MPRYLIAITERPMKRIRSVGMDYIEITGTIEAETERAILLNDGARKVWIPKSQLEDVERRGGIAIITMAEWLAIEKELV